jgi:hypothetical protein
MSNKEFHLSLSEENYYDNLLENMSEAKRRQDLEDAEQEFEYMLSEDQPKRFALPDGTLLEDSELKKAS